MKPGEQNKIKFNYFLFWKMWRFFVETKFQRTVTSLFFVQFSSTKAQINRLDERNPLVPLFFLISGKLNKIIFFAIYWVSTTKNVKCAKKRLELGQQFLRHDFFLSFWHLKPPEWTWFSKKKPKSTRPK